MVHVVEQLENKILEEWKKVEALRPFRRDDSINGVSPPKIQHLIYFILLDSHSCETPGSFEAACELCWHRT